MTVERAKARYAHMLKPPPLHLATDEKKRRMRAINKVQTHVFSFAFSRHTPFLPHSCLPFLPDSRFPFSQLTVLFLTHASLVPDSRLPFFPILAAFCQLTPFFLSHTFSFSRLTPQPQTGLSLNRLQSQQSPIARAGHEECAISRTKQLGAMFFLDVGRWKPSARC